MSDTTLNAFLASGTNAERLLFTPTPPTPVSGPDPGYLFYETDTGDLYAWDGAAWQQVNVASGAGIDELTGDVTAGPGTGSQAATIAADAVTNAKAANMAQLTIKGRAAAAGTGDPTDLTANQVSTILDTATDPFLRTSAASAGVSDGDKGDITVSGSGTVYTVDNDVVTNAKAANMAESTVKGRAAAAGTGDPTDLTPSQLRTLLFSGAMVRKASDLTGVDYTGTGVVITWDTEIYDVGGWHDTVTNNSRMTVPTGVTKVNLSAQIRLTNVTANTLTQVNIFKNGSVVYSGSAVQDTYSTATTRNMSVTTLGVECVAGDYFEVMVFSGSDTSLDLIATRSTFTIQAVEG